MESDFRYFSRRAAEERRRAQFAITPAAQQRHNELADMFASKAAHRDCEDLLTRLGAE
jgi:hypothetical protein